MEVPGHLIVPHQRIPHTGRGFRRVENKNLHLVVRLTVLKFRVRDENTTFQYVGQYATTCSGDCLTRTRLTGTFLSKGKTRFSKRMPGFTKEQRVEVCFALIFQ